jgi:hypothetical protein
MKVGNRRETVTPLRRPRALTSPEKDRGARPEEIRGRTGPKRRSFATPYVHVVVQRQG